MPLEEHTLIREPEQVLIPLLDPNQGVRIKPLEEHTLIHRVRIKPHEEHP